MSERVNPRRRGSYGIDAPYGVAIIAAVVVLELGLAITSRRAPPVLAAFFVSGILGSYLYATLRGKFVVWAELLERLNLRGDERILDLGCGRGAVLLMAAQHLTSGRAVGVDVWRRVDQSGNSEEATRRNAVAEGVADRVELHTADMTALPFEDDSFDVVVSRIDLHRELVVLKKFEDDSFDVVVSSLAIHNIWGRAGREKAIDEAVRVLRPGGRLLIADIRGTRRHQARLGEIGMSDVVRRRLGWRFWRGGPWVAIQLVTATKPGRNVRLETAPPVSSNPRQALLEREPSDSTAEGAGR